MKNKLLIPILLLGLLTLYFACQNEDDIVQREQSVQRILTKKILSKKDIDSNIRVSELLNLIDNKNNQKSLVYNSINNLYIYTEEVIYLEDGDNHSYTFYVYSLENNSVLKNIVLSVNAEGLYDAYLWTYYNNGVDDINSETQIDVVKLENFDSNGILSKNDPTTGCSNGELQYIEIDWEDGSGNIYDESSACPGDCTIVWYWLPCPNTGGGSTSDDSGSDGSPDNGSSNNDSGNYDSGIDDGGNNNGGSTSGPSGGSTSGDDNDPNPVITTPSIRPIECTVRIPGDEDGDCDVDAIDCQLGGYDAEICNCVAEDNGNNLEDCLFEEAASTALFKKKGEDEEAVPANLEFALPCFDTENNQNGYHDVTIYVKQPVPNSTQISAGLGDAGHTFIELAQAVNGNVVRQYIGLYPLSDDVSPNNPIVDGIFIDDSEEEFDVSLRIELSPEQFNNIINYLTSFGETNEYGDLINVNPQYDLNEFNCSDFGLNIMNFTDIQIPDSTGEWGGELGYDLGSGTCPALLGQDIRNTDFGPNVQKDLDGGISGNSTENLCDD